MTDSTQLTIREASELLDAGEVSATELLEATFVRIEATEPVVHAYAFVLEASARRAAREADDEIRAGRRRGPLHGIPVGVKDLCYTAGEPTEAGSRVLAGFVPSYDATVVERLRGAGAVIVGKTVTHEFAYGQNLPPTRNAWNAECYPGGSSAGSGVAVAVRSAFGAVGTDTGGSVRVPASVNGVVGLKPTFGRVSRHGVVPMSSSLDHVGPLARTVGDCALLLGAIAGSDVRDRTSIDVPVGDYAAAVERGVEGLRVGVERDYFFYEGVSDDVCAAVEQAIAELERAGAAVVDVEIPALEHMPLVGLAILLVDTSAYHRRFLRERSADYDPGTRLMLELGELVPGTAYVAAQQARTVLRDAVREAFEAAGIDALAAPTLPRTTVGMDELTLSLAGGQTALASYVHHCFPANVTGQPALTVPCGFSEAGLPIGFQLIGRPFEEEMLFRFAHAYESATDWHTRAPAVGAAA